VTWLQRAWNYIWDGARTHPFNTITLLIAAAAALYARSAARAGHRQADEAKRQRQLNESVFAAQSGAMAAQAQDNKAMQEVAKRSAEAAEESAKATRIIAQLGQRPWMSIDEVKIEKRDTHSGLPTGVVVTVRNGGRTPALSVQCAQWLVIEEDLADPPPYPNLEIILWRSYKGATSVQVRRGLFLPPSRGMMPLPETALSKVVSTSLSMDSPGILTYSVKTTRQNGHIDTAVTCASLPTASITI
jgi:hypothetical protein